MKLPFKSIVFVLAIIAFSDSNAQHTHSGHHSGVHVDHFSKTGDTVVYSRSTGAVLSYSKGYSGQPGFKNNPATTAVPNAGTIPSGNYNITGSSPVLNGRLHSNNIGLAPQTGTNTYGRDNFRIHGGNSAGTASQGCIITLPQVRQSIANSGSTGTVTVRPSYPQSYNYGRNVQMPSQYVPSTQPIRNQSYNYNPTPNYGHGHYHGH